MNFETLEIAMRWLPAASGLMFCALYWYNRIRKSKKSFEIEGMFIVGLAGSAVPPGLLCIATPFAPSAFILIQDAKLYLAFAGISLIFISVKTFRETCSK